MRVWREISVVSSKGASEPLRYTLGLRVLQLSTRVSCSQSGESGAKERREWEEAMAAVLRDIASSPKQQPPPVVQIVIYESSV